MTEVLPFGLVRSALFVPCCRPDRVGKAMASAADVVVLDLEDSVPPQEKAAARSVARETLGRCSSRPTMVRVNSLGSGLLEDDLSVVVVPGLRCMVAPKVDDAQQLAAICALLSDRERVAGMAPGSVAIVPFAESARAVENAYGIASAKLDPPRLYTLAFGAADYTLDLGVDLTPGAEEQAYPRSRIAVACRAAGIARPLDTPYMIDIHDADGLRADALRAKQLGFQGKLCVHPRQLETCNTVFSPSREEIERARAVVEAFREGERQGLGAVQVEGMMVDYPVARRFMAILELAAKLQPSPECDPLAAGEGDRDRAD